MASSFNFNRWLKALWVKIMTTTLDLFKVMIPIVLLIKIIEELGGIDLIANLLSPVMSLVGLPPEMGLVWATTMISNLYGGLIVFVTLPSTTPLSIADVTVLCVMMLFAHSLLVETAIAKKSGVTVFASLAIRVGSALIAGMMLNEYYTTTGVLQEPSVAIFSVSTQPETLLQWVVLQIETLGKIFLIIAVLITFLDLLKLSGIERLFIWLLKPLLRLLGLDEKVASMSIIGMTLGLTYGGALLISEAKAGVLSNRQVFGAIALISICHALIEDTLLVMLLGAHISGVLWWRVCFSFILIAILVRASNYIDDARFQRYLSKNV